MDDNSKNPRDRKEIFFGKEVSDILESAQNGSLNHDIEARLNDILGTVSDGVGKTMDYVSRELENASARQQNGSSSRFQGSATYRSSDYQRSAAQRTRNNQSTTAKGKNDVPDRASPCRPPKGGLALRIIGWSLTGVFGFIECLLVAVAAASLDWKIMQAGIVILPFLIAGLIVLGIGIGKKNRLKRYKKYVAELQGKNYAQIKEMAHAIDRDEKFTLKDIRKMIADGIFPHGRLDDEQTYLMVTRDVYEDYRRMERSKKEREAEARRMTETEKLNEMEREMAARAEAEKAARMTEVEKTVAEGRMYLQDIDIANQALPEETITNKLNRLHGVVERILFCVEKQPDKLEDIRQFMKYYLPTTLKLVKAYQGFEENPIQGSNIQTAKEEIELSLDTINDGFERLLNNLFEQDAMDISSDIYVLQSMLAREGLTKDPFEDIGQQKSSMDMPDPFGDVNIKEGSVLGSNE